MSIAPVSVVSGAGLFAQLISGSRPTRVGYNLSSTGFGGSRQPVAYVHKKWISVRDSFAFL